MTTEDAAEKDPIANDIANSIGYVRDIDGVIVAECWEISIDWRPPKLYMYEYWTYFTSDRWLTFPACRKISYISSIRLINVRAREMGKTI